MPISHCHAANLSHARISIFVQRRHFRRLVRELSPFVSEKPGQLDWYEGVSLTLSENRRVCCCLLDDSPESVDIARRRPLGTIVLDSRYDELSDSVANSLVGRLLPELLLGQGSRKRPRRQSILVVLPDNRISAYHAFAAGTFQLRGILVAPVEMSQILDAAYRMSRPAAPGRVALCLAGGGIEGMFWEIGVLRALDAHLKNASVTDFDVFSGISAGSVLNAFIANGVKPYEIANALHGRPSRVTPITRAMLFNPNVKEVALRLVASLGDVVRGRWITEPIDSALRITPNGLFSGQKLHDYLVREFSRTGMCDCFDQLSKDLFIGVTDQDEGIHVSFGTEGYRDMPISMAVRASTAMTPYYDAAKVGDRYYVDGIFTRTIDIDVAIAHGATLIICVDPLRPVQTSEVGYVSLRGGVFNTVQSVKSMLRTRFTEMITKAEEAHPNVSVYVFSPTAKDMEQMSGTMMRFFFRTDTERLAYDSALEQLASDHDWLSEELQRHGYALLPVDIPPVLNGMGT